MPMQAPDDDTLYEFIYSVTEPMQEVIYGLINQTAIGSDEDTAEIFGIDRTVEYTDLQNLFR